MARHRRVGLLPSYTESEVEVITGSVSILWVLLALAIPFLAHRFGINLPYLTSNGPVTPSDPTPETPLTVKDDVKNLLDLLRGVVRTELEARTPVSNPGDGKVVKQADGSLLITPPTPIAK